MRQEEFIEILKKKKYSYKIEGDKIVVTHEFNIFLDSLTSLPPGVEFKNEVSVWLDSLTSLPPDVEFKNGGDVYLESLTSLPHGVEFKNGGNVGFISLMSVYFNDWKGNIKGIDSKRLLNLMISKGVFER